MPSPIYLDYNGTTPHHPDVISAMQPYIESAFGNPSSGHWYGEQPRHAVETARKQVAALIQCNAAEVHFNSGGTEANNHAIKGIARAMKDKGRHIITSTFEHPAVLNVCRYLVREGFAVTYVPVDAKGMIHPADVAGAIRSDTILISVMHANNEVGTVQPIEEVSALAHEHGIVMHTDAAQSVGKIPVDVQAMGVDLLSVAGHKVYAPKGIGALYIRSGIKPETFCHGAGQEMGWRAGTENVIQVVGLGQACEVAGRGIQAHADRLRALRDRLHRGIEASVTGAVLNGHADLRLPNTVSLAFAGLEADRFLAHIKPDVAASPGAACHSGSAQLSHVLEAMKVPPDLARGTIRFSVGRMTTDDDIDRAVQVIAEAARHFGLS